MALIESLSAAPSAWMNATRLQHLLLYFPPVCVSGRLAASVKCDLGVFLNARWAVKRRCHYNFRFPLFSPLLHWSLLPVTPAITCFPQVLLVITLTSGVACWGISNQFSRIPDPIKARKTPVFRKQETLLEGHAWFAFTFSLGFKSLMWDICGSILDKSSGSWVDKLIHSLEKRRKVNKNAWEPTPTHLIEKWKDGIQLCHK